MKLVESNTEAFRPMMNGSKNNFQAVKLIPNKVQEAEELKYSKKSLFNITITLTEQGQNIINVLDQFICREFNITREELKSEDRYMPLPKARGAFTSILRSNFDFPLKLIGMHLGGRDHSSILMAERRAKEFYKKNAAFRTHYDKVEKYFKALVNAGECNERSENKSIAG